MPIPLGLIKCGDIYDEVIIELLNHQGIIYKIIDENTDENLKFPCVLLPRYDEEKNRRALNLNKSNNVILAENEINLEYILKAFSGILDDLYLQKKLITPIINGYEITLVNKIREIYYRQDLPLIRKWFWPEFKNACCIITHDIDGINYPPSVHKCLSGQIKDLLSSLEILKYVYIRYIKGKYYGDNITEIIDLEKEKGITSTFYFLADYGKYQRHIPAILEQLKKEDCEIGLHGSQFSFQSPELLQEEKQKIESITKTTLSGIRQHILNFNIPQTWVYQEETGLKYDSSISYNDELGFRCGICYPYRPFNYISHKRFNIVELPTSFMDWTVVHKHMNQNESLKTIMNIGTNIEKYNGCFVLNFHNLFLNEKTYPEILNLFIKTLNYVKEREYWITTAENCVNWWLKRENAEINISLSGKDIIGSSTERDMPLVVERKNKKSFLTMVKDNDFIMKV